LTTFLFPLAHFMTPIIIRNGCRCLSYPVTHFAFFCEHRTQTCTCREFI
jgi:hypothetical protein